MQAIIPGGLANRTAHQGQAGVLSHLAAFVHAKERGRKKAIVQARLTHADMNKDVMGLVAAALRKAEYKRDEEDIALIESLLEGIDKIADIRSKISEQGMQNLVAGCTLLELDEMQAVCRYGEGSNAVYYVLQGEIAVTSLNLPKYTKELLNSTNILNKIKTRSLFGEAGVLSKSSRTANCVATVPSKLVMIAARNYVESVGKEIMANRQQKVSFLLKVQLFETWDYPKLVGFYESICRNKIHPRYGTLIVTPGKYSKSIYLVYKGQVEVGTYLRKEETKPEDEPLASRVMFMKKNALNRGAFISLMVLEEAGYFGDENNPKTNPEQQLAVRVVSQDCELFEISRELLLMNTFKMKAEHNSIETQFAMRNKHLISVLKEQLKSRKNFLQKSEKKTREGYNNWLNLFGRRENETPDEVQKLSGNISKFVTLHSRLAECGGSMVNIRYSKPGNGLPLLSPKDKATKSAREADLDDILWFKEMSSTGKTHTRQSIISKTREDTTGSFKDLGSSTKRETEKPLTKGSVDFLEFCKKKLALNKHSIADLGRRIERPRPQFFITTTNTESMKRGSKSLRSIHQKRSYYLPPNYSNLEAATALKISKAGSSSRLRSNSLTQIQPDRQVTISPFKATAH